MNEEMKNESKLNETHVNFTYVYEKSKASMKQTSLRL